jgi:hypothetical protein
VDVYAHHAAGEIVFQGAADFRKHLLARACGSVYEAALKGGKISLTPALGD